MAVVLMAGAMLAAAGCNDVGGAGSAALNQRGQRQQHIHDENAVIDEISKH